MEIDVVSFPALMVAEDGWVSRIDTKNDISAWTRYAIAKYKTRCLLLYDSQNRAWQIESIEPSDFLGMLSRLAWVFFNRKVPVRITIQQITEAPLERVRDLLMTAIDADDDILTQFAEPTDLKRAIQGAGSFETLVQALQDKRAI